VAAVEAVGSSGNVGSGVIVRGKVGGRGSASGDVGSSGRGGGGGGSGLDGGEDGNYKWRTMHHCLNCLVWIYLRRNSLRKKKRQKNSLFIYGNHFEEIRIWLRFSAMSDSEQSLTKNKKRITAVTH
jgi:hypothetical protein